MKPQRHKCYARATFPQFVQQDPHLLQVPEIELFWACDKNRKGVVRVDDPDLKLEAGGTNGRATDRFCVWRLFSTDAFELWRRLSDLFQPEGGFTRRGLSILSTETSVWDQAVAIIGNVRESIVERWR
jgi:hypothetical protein